MSKNLGPGGRCRKIDPLIIDIDEVTSEWLCAQLAGQTMADGSHGQ